MPELPEVEVVKLYLESKLTNLRVVKIDILNQKSFIGDLDQVVGQKIVSFSRVGKQLSIHLENKLILLVHLKMTGQLLYLPPLSRGGPNGGGVFLGHPTKTFDQKSTRIKFLFSDSSILYFNDQRKFGWIRLMSSQEISQSQSTLGKDIFDPTFTPQYLYHQLQCSSRPVKIVLLDQHFFAGIGNIYANDALFLSKIHPATKSNTISLSQSKLIHHHLIAIMQQSVLAGGSTMKDNLYKRPDGSLGSNQFHFQVYQRMGEPCLVCGNSIVRITLGGRGTFYCPDCQFAL